MTVIAGNLTTLVPLPRFAGRRVDAQFPRRSVSRSDVVAVAAEVFRGGFPVGVDHPALRPADFCAAFAAIEQDVQIPGHVAEILAQGWRVLVESGKDQPLVTIHLRHRD